MKKLTTTLLSICVVTSLTACGNATSTEPTTMAETSQEATIEETTKSPLSDLEAVGDINVEKELFDVVITIPAEYVGETTQEDLEKAAEEKGYKSIVLNDDGSATYTMTKSQHKQMMEELTANINSSLSEMIGSEDYPNITAIEANDNFTKFTITTKSEELDLAESFSVIGFYTFGGMYHIFNGTSVDNIEVEFINADSGEVISSANSKDMAKDNQ